MCVLDPSATAVRRCCRQTIIGVGKRVETKLAQCAFYSPALCGFGAPEQKYLLPASLCRTTDQTTCNLRAMLPREVSGGRVASTGNALPAKDVLPGAPFVARKESVTNTSTPIPLKLARARGQHRGTPRQPHAPC